MTINKSSRLLLLALNSLFRVFTGGEPREEESFQSFVSSDLRAREMQKRKLRPVVSLALLRMLLTFAISAIALAALLAPHFFPSSKVQLPKQKQESGFTELGWTREHSPPPLSKLLLPKQKLDGVKKGKTELEKLWKPPPNRGFQPCIRPSQSYLPPTESKGYLLVNTNGGLNQMRAGICDMVAVARIINATLVVPELDKKSFWQDTSNFSDVFDEKHFISALANDVEVIKKLPKELETSSKAVKYFRSWSGVEYYQDEIYPMWNEYQVIRAAKSDLRLANNNLPPDIQKLRCRAFYHALRFAPHIEAFGKLLVERMRSYGPYIALHLRYEKDMLAFSGCTYGLSTVEADELTKIRENTPHWKVKDIDAMEQRTKGYCPLTPKEVGVFLTALGYPSSTPIYIASGEIYGGESRIVDLQSHFPILMSKVQTDSQHGFRSLLVPIMPVLLDIDNEEYVDNHVNFFSVFFY